RLPAEILTCSLARHLLAREVTRPCLGVDDLDVSHGVPNGLGDVEDGDALGAVEVVDAVDRDGLEPQDDPLRKVFNVDKLPELEAVSGDRQRLPGERLLDED